MSSFSKNLIPRRIHKERAQPAARIAKHGLLEKKKDYKLRAKHQNRKAAHLKLLREKAALRNPDEFYYAMSRKTTDDGVIHRVVDKSLENAIPLKNRTKDQRLLVENQDSRYVAYKLALEKGKVASLEKGLHSISHAQSVQRKHILFADDDDDADAIVAEKHQSVKSTQSRNLLSHVPRSLKKDRKKAYRMLDRHSNRCEKLNTVFNDMSVEKNLMKKGRRVLVRPSDKKTGAPPIFRWKQERSR